MEKLKPFVNFDEVEEAELVVDNNCECYYIEHDGNKYLTWKNVDSISNEDLDADVIEYKNSYYSILDGKLVLQETIQENKDGIVNGRTAKIHLLKDILPIKGNSSYTLTKEDILGIINFKEEKSEKPRKTYF